MATYFNSKVPTSFKRVCYGNRNCANDFSIEMSLPMLYYEKLYSRALRIKVDTNISVNRFQIFIMQYESRLIRFHLYLVFVIAILKIDLCSHFRAVIVYNWFVSIITAKKLGAFFNHEKRKEKREKERHDI